MVNQAKKEYEALNNLLKTLLEDSNINLTAKSIIGEEIECQMQRIKFFIDEVEPEGNKEFILKYDVIDENDLVPYMQTAEGGWIRVNWEHISSIFVNTNISFFNPDKFVYSFPELNGRSSFNITKAVERTEDGDYKICYE